MLPVFFGLSGTGLSPQERRLFGEARPAGYILFRRNIEDGAQVRRLTDSLRDISGDENIPILIDQEGGRVARLAPPRWPAFPPGAVFGDAYRQAPLTALAAAHANARALALMVKALGINVDCLPLLDVRSDGMHDVIGDRSYGDDPLAVASLGRATLNGLRDGGCIGVIKHLPGHGRATVDSHLSLPTVTASAEELERDLLPFRELADAPMGMTAHILFPAWDKELCVSFSPEIIRTVIRENIGFGNLLMSDDLGMQALQHQPGGDTMAGRALGVLEAGCDIALHCSGDFAEMEEIVNALPPITAIARERLTRAMNWAGEAGDGDIASLSAHRDQLLAAADGEACPAV